MQKNLSLKNIKEAQKNMFSFTAVFVVINIFFLSVGALLYIYANKYGITVEKTDYLYPTIALKYLGIVPAMVFMLGLTAATFATTDSALQPSPPPFASTF
jgi:Na+/pantothenate symporter